MSESEDQAAVNRANAAKSTGPVSIAGKTMASQNACRHGVFSARHLLEDEDRQAFAALLTDVQETLKPVGAIELELAERIAVNIWRQRRLVIAEGASLALQRSDKKIARLATQVVDIEVGRTVRAEDLQLVNPEHVAWCRKVIDEVEALDTINPDGVKTGAPLLWQQLLEEAESDDETPEAYLYNFEDGITEFVTGLYDWCQKELGAAEERPKLLALAAQLRQKRLVLPPEQLELFARYQTTLDNQLYRALKALRDAQAWRFKTLEGEAKQSSTVQDLGT